MLSKNINISDSLPGKDLFQINNRINLDIQSELNENHNPYDLEININSILGFLKGWDILYNNDGKQKYEFAKRNRTKIFSVIGNKNKGKSFILSKIAKRDLPWGFSVTTKGLSISFPKFGNLALLDSVGFESPLLETDGEEYRLKSDNKEENERFYQKLDKLEKEIKSFRESKNKNINEIKDKENEYFRERNNFRNKIERKDDQLYELTNERRTTDFFLQRFIIENANVILLVVGKLSIDDQFFLNKLTKLIKDDKSIFLQKVIIIHNLMTMVQKSTVEDYIQNTLKKSLTFKLKEKSDLLLLDATKPYNKIRYYEEDRDFADKEIVHLIMAKYNTEAGDYYNESAVDYIRKIGTITLNTTEFDIIGRLRSYFCKVSETILKFDNPNEKIKPEMIELVNNNGQEKLKLNYHKKIELETFYGDIFSELSRNPKFNPEYHIITNNNKYLIIFLECPGNIDNIKAEVNFHENNAKVTIKGKREKTNIKTMGRNFGSGDFELNIRLRGDDAELTGNIEKIENFKNGFFLIKLERDKQ